MLSLKAPGRRDGKIAALPRQAGAPTALACGIALSPVPVGRRLPGT